MLKLRLKDNKHSGVWLVEPNVSIGRESGNDLVINDSSVAPQHAQIIVKHEKLTLKNLVGQGVSVNGEPVSQSAVLRMNDRLEVGSTELEVVDPKLEQRPSTAPAVNTGWTLKANHTALANRLFPVKSEMVIGRSNDCDITLVAAHLSRHHAKLIIKNGLLYVRDLGSANGTFLNGERVTEARVRRGDELRLDTLIFGVLGPAADDLDKTSIRPASVLPPQAARTAPVVESRSSSLPVQRPSEAPVARQVAGDRGLARPAPEYTANSGRKATLLWALGLLVAIAAAAGLAWQQGLLAS